MVYKIVEVETEIETHISCPECGEGSRASEFMLFCATCLEEFDEGSKIVCLKEYHNGSPNTHYHIDCAKKDGVM